MMMGDTYFLFWLSVRTDLKVIAVKSQSGSGWLLATYWAELQVPENHFLYDCATQLLPTPRQVELSVCSSLLVTFANGPGVLLVPTARSH